VLVESKFLINYYTQVFVFRYSTKDVVTIRIIEFLFISASAYGEYNTFAKVQVQVILIAPLFKLIDCSLKNC